MRFGILIYDDVEPIDLGATFGVLSMARRIYPAIEMFGVAEKPGQVRCANGLRVEADHGYADCPGCDMLIVTGGPGWHRMAGHAPTLDFLKSLPEGAGIASICTGAMILAAAGLLDGHGATTKTEVAGAERPPLDVLVERHAAVRAHKAVFVRSGNRFTSGGVALGIDGVLYLIGHMLGDEVRDETARIMEYSRALEANAAALPLHQSSAPLRDNVT